jgi:hypothetical protein
LCTPQIGRSDEERQKPGAELFLACFSVWEISRQKMGGFHGRLEQPKMK